VTIAYGKARVKTKILMQSRRRQKPIFESRSVYTQNYMNGLFMSDQEKQGQSQQPDRLLAVLHKIILYSVKLLAVMMIMVILASIVDVGFILYDKIIFTRPVGVLHIENIVTVLGAFLAVLIAIEIYHNIIVYLKEDTVHLKLVLSTALIAIARKVIVLDYSIIPPQTMYAVAALVMATGIAYWIVSYKSSE